MVQTARINQDSKRRKRNRSKKTKVNNYELKRQHIRSEFQKRVEYNVKVKNSSWAVADIEKCWVTYKNIALEAAEQVSGKTKVGVKKKTTAWRNEQIKREVWRL